MIERVTHLRALRVRGFRSLRDVEVKLGRVNVLVGPNGAGKSNLVDALRFIRDSARKSVSQAIELRGGFDQLLFHGAEQEPAFSIGAVIETQHKVRGGDVDDYTLIIKKPVAVASALDRIVHGERLERVAEDGGVIFSTHAGELHRAYDFKDDSGERHVDDNDYPFPPDALLLTALPDLGVLRMGADFTPAPDTFVRARFFDVNVEVARGPVVAGMTTELRDDAAQLASFLRWMSQARPDEFARLVLDARSLVPGLEGIEFESIGGAVAQIVVMLAEKGLAKRTPLGLASFGTVRLLALLALLHDWDPPPLVCIEEIDHGIHPWAFDRLVELIRAASKRTQLLITTHSPAFVNRLKAEEIIVCERDPRTGESLIPAVPARRIKAILRKADGQVGPGELWFSGTLGGVPREKV